MYCVNRTKLQAKIVECGMTQDGLAAELGIDRGTFRRRLNAEKLQIKDIHKICEVLRLSPDEAIAIFLTQQSQKCS